MHFEVAHALVLHENRGTVCLQVLPGCSSAQLLHLSSPETPTVHLHLPPSSGPKPPPTSHSFLAPPRLWKERGSLTPVSQMSHCHNDNTLGHETLEPHPILAQHHFPLLSALCAHRKVIFWHPCSPLKDMTVSARRFLPSGHSSALLLTALISRPQQLSGLLWKRYSWAEKHSLFLQGFQLCNV